MQTMAKQNNIAAPYPSVTFSEILNIYAPNALPATIQPIANPVISPRCFLPNSLIQVILFKTPQLPLAKPRDTINPHFTPVLLLKILRKISAEAEEKAGSA